jgi:hypothetical protein
MASSPGSGKVSVLVSLLSVPVTGEYLAFFMRADHFPWRVIVFTRNGQEYYSIVSPGMVRRTRDPSGPPL